MQRIQLLKKYLRTLLRREPAETGPEKAYDLWAAGYDAQPDNLMLALDDALFLDLLNGVVTLKNKHIADIGCGTGRHWTKIISRQPASITGFDVSAEMLAICKQKFPEQTLVKLDSEKIVLPDQTCDIVISTLAIAHIPDAALALQEWVRILKPEGEIILTDYHPQALASGGNRTFQHKGRLVAVKNYVHPLSDIKAMAKQLDLAILRIAERNIDETVKPFYEKKNALAVYEKFKDQPIIYGIHLKKNHAPS